MNRESLESRIQQVGRALFERMGVESPSIFQQSFWAGKLLDWTMRDEAFKINLFRFIDVLPSLTSDAAVQRHLEEYLSTSSHLPEMMKKAMFGGGFGKGLRDKLLAHQFRKQVQNMARQFMIEADDKVVAGKLRELRSEGFAFTADIVGEAVVSETEADAYQQAYLNLLDVFQAESSTWKPLGNSDNTLDWGYAPLINISVKPSALFSHTSAAAFEPSVAGILQRLRPIYHRVMQLHGALTLDMEQRSAKNITLEVYRRLRSDSEFAAYPHLGLVLQAYMPETEADLNELLAWAKQEHLPVSVRLVKGAYWDFELAVARQSGWEDPVFTDKTATDACFERMARMILENHQHCYLACGSHNVRSVGAVLALAEGLSVPAERFEFQVLYGMAEPLARALLAQTGRVRMYCAQGKLLPGMAYLIRRLLENTSNESFLRHRFAEGQEIDGLLQNPQAISIREDAVEVTQEETGTPSQTSGQLSPFQNEPFADFTDERVRNSFQEAIQQVRGQLGKTWPLWINGEEIHTDTQETTLNPANPEEIIGCVCQASPEQLETAIQAASGAQKSWAATPVRQRADYLLRAAQIARERIYELAAWEILEEGKQWDGAHKDIAEGIDFLEYYARQMLLLSEGQPLLSPAGEINTYFYKPRGTAAVISPWNFPLAIPCGMCAAALVTGNCVLFKPSERSGVVGYWLADIFRQAGLPPGVFHFVPGHREQAGRFLVEHPLVDVIAFTGSVKVGLAILQQTAQVSSGQRQIKKVIAEMGGKNAIIVDDDADLDAAVPHIVESAFGYQGQKCSACSRVIVLEAIYPDFRERLIEAVKSLQIGPAEDPQYQVGPVIDRRAAENIQQYIGLARQEGNILHQSNIPGKGCYVPLAVVENITPQHRLAQEEVFGPLLALMRVKDFDHALTWANDSRFALTGGLFSRLPSHLEQARQNWHVGNLYLNRGCTGALVGRQPFGGLRLSGVGAKAGGPDYLLQFTEARAISENAIRRGFAPLGNDNP